MNSLDLKEYVNKVVIIYEQTPAFPFGKVCRILDYDSASRGHISFLALDLTKDRDNSGAFGAGWDQAMWVGFSDIKEIVNYKRPRIKLWQKLKSLVKQVLIRVLKTKLSMH